MEAQRPAKNGQGILFYKHSSSSDYGTVCDDNFNEKAADIICQEMGYENGAQRWSSYELTATGFHGSLPTVLDDIVCSSVAEVFSDCRFDLEDEDCDHSEDVYLQCREGNNCQNNDLLSSVIGAFL